MTVFRVKSPSCKGREADREIIATIMRLCERSGDERRGRDDDSNVVTSEDACVRIFSRRRNMRRRSGKTTSTKTF